MDPESARRLFEAELATIEGVLDHLCARHALEGAEGDSFRSYARLRLMEDEYAALRKFEGRSRLKTYLTAVLANALRDYRVARWGRWRPSAAARKLGPTGVLLDTYINRDGHSLEEASSRACSRDDVSESPAEVRTIAAQLPRRERREFVPLDGRLAIASTNRPDATLDEQEQELRRDEALAALDEAVSRLSERDQAMLKLRFWEGMTVASIARQFGIEQRPLYRRFEASKKELRKLLEESGVHEHDVAEMFEA
jgi:RNA polymerase sigma factor for flagellar operon FliA